jgi:hypothetical protein
MGLFWNIHVCQKLNQQMTKSISNGAQYVTPDSKMYREKVKMFWFSSGNWFFLHQMRAASRGW